MGRERKGYQPLELNTIHYSKIESVFLFGVREGERKEREERGRGEREVRRERKLRARGRE